MISTSFGHCWIKFENGYTEGLNVKCSGLQAIAILYYMDRRED